MVTLTWFTNIIDLFITEGVILLVVIGAIKFTLGFGYDYLASLNTKPF